MDVSILVAQLLGAIYLAIGVGMFLDRDYYKRAFSKMLDDAGFIYFGGVMAFVVGFLIVTNHNEWVKSWEVLVTIIGWVALIKGVMLLALPSIMLEFSRNMLKPNNIDRMVYPILIFGAIFSYYGFLAS